MHYQTRRVVDRRTMNDFLALPERIYKGDPGWVAPIRSEVRRTLDRKKNPYFRGCDLELLVCYRNSAPCARLALVVNPGYATSGQMKLALFGFFESIDDSDAAGRLFDAALAWCRDRGVAMMEGPFNPNHYSELGLQLSHFGCPPVFFQSYNHSYYRDLLEQRGFSLTKVIHTRRREMPRDRRKEKRSGSAWTKASSGYNLRAFQKGDLANELERIRQVFNDAFSTNWRFLPLSREEYIFSAKFLNLVTRPDLLLFVEHQGEPVGVVECVEDVNPLLKNLRGSIGPLKYLRYQLGRRHLRTLVIYAVGIRKAFQGTRVFPMLLEATRRMASNYDVLETTWMSDDNPLAIRAAQHLGLERDREFGIFQKNVTAD
jgi:hypothetical protein